MFFSDNGRIKKNDGDGHIDDGDSNSHDNHDGSIQIGGRDVDSHDEYSHTDDGEIDSRNSDCHTDGEDTESDDGENRTDDGHIDNNDENSNEGHKWWPGCTSPFSPAYRGCSIKRNQMPFIDWETEEMVPVEKSVYQAYPKRIHQRIEVRQAGVPAWSMLLAIYP